MRPHGPTKLGFFPLPIAEAKRLKNWLSFPERFSTLDPCVGNGVAFAHVLQIDAEPVSELAQFDRAKYEPSQRSGSLDSNESQRGDLTDPACGSLIAGRDDPERALFRVKRFTVPLVREDG